MKARTFNAGPQQYSSICQSFLLGAQPLGLYLGNYCLCLYVQVYSLLFAALVSKFQALHWGLWSTLNWYFFRVKNMDLFSVFCFPSNICWRGSFCSIVCFGCLCQKSGGCSCVDLCLSFLFCSIVLHICFCDSTVHFYCYWGRLEHRKHWPWSSLDLMWLVLSIFHAKLLILAQWYPLLL
jgi:hypothetical protein